MSTTYDYNKSPVNVDALTHEIDAAGLPDPEGITYNSDQTPYNLHITFTSALDSGQETTLNTTVSNHTGDPWVYPPTDLNYFMQPDVQVEDPRTSMTGPFCVMQTLINRRELFNDTDSPIYISDFTPILGSGGWAEDHADRIDNLETIHVKLGWHNQEVIQATYNRPKDLLVYYGWLNSFNSTKNAWNNEKVAQDMAQYDILVFGDGIQNPAHGDYANTQVIIPRIKALKPTALIFGYVSSNQTLTDFQTKVGQWETLQVDGIFMDESGYDFGVTRSDFNTRVDYVHGQTYASLCFANAWNTDHILGTANDPSYPNSTYNPSAAESNLTNNDWILLESFAINTTAYSASDGYETKSQWADRGVKFKNLRATYGVNFAGVGVINNDNTNGQRLFDFGFVSSLMWALESFGSSDTSYASSSSSVTLWQRPNTADLGIVYTLNSSVQVDVGDADVYHAFIDHARLTLDFSSGAQRSYIAKIPSSTTHGECYITNNSTATNFGASNTWTVFAGTYNAGDLNHALHASGVLTVLTSGKYFVVGSISAFSGGNNKDYDFGISVNNADCLSKSMARSRLSSSCLEQSISCILDLGVGNTVQAKVRNISDTTTITIVHMNLSLYRI